MTVYVFGNPEVDFDNQATLVAKQLKIPGVEFRFVAPNEDLPEKEKLVIMDGVMGINKITLFKNINKIEKVKSTTVHDFDLGFQLKYLQKLRKIKKVTIVGIPDSAGMTDYLRIQSILRKLVAQDMQGS